MKLCHISTNVLPNIFLLISLSSLKLKFRREGQGKRKGGERMAEGRSGGNRREKMTGKEGERRG